MEWIVGTAGWAIPRPVAADFPTEGSGLQRYAARFRGVEINSTFYRPHRAATFERWRVDTPADFRFAAKLPKALTHVARLVDCEAGLARFAAEVAVLGEKLGPLLVQLPPSLVFDAVAAEGFFAALREVWVGAVVCEPRHLTWFDAEADGLLRRHRIARVAADPACCPAAARPGGWPNLAYWRLHGSPHMYRSPYDAEWLEALAADVRASAAAEVWCVFDNTTSGAAAANALAFVERLSACSAQPASAAPGRRR